MVKQSQVCNESKVMTTTMLFYIPAYFGSNVASYFKFLRILLLLNITAGILMISFTTVPQVNTKIICHFPYKIFHGCCVAYTVKTIHLVIICACLCIVHI